MAVTDLAAVIETVQALVPVQAPDHPLKVEFALAVAVSVTLVPELYGSVQSLPQLIPAGVELTVPVPVPVFVTVRL